MSAESVSTIRVAGVDYGAFQPEAGQMPVAWRYQKHDGDWHVCGSLDQGGKDVLVRTWTAAHASGCAHEFLGPAAGRGRKRIAGIEPL